MTVRAEATEAEARRAAAASERNLRMLVCGDFDVIGLSKAGMCVEEEGLDLCGRHCCCVAVDTPASAGDD